MKIEIYKDAWVIPEKYLTSLVDAQIECWWSKPFDEYLICKHSKCRALFSIEDVHLDINKFRENRWKNMDFKCGECWWDTELVYEKETFLEAIKDYVKWEVSVILLIDEWNIEWFWVITKTTISSLINNDFATRNWSYDKKELLMQMSKQIFWVDDASEENIILWNQLYVSPDIRKWNISFELSSELFSLNEDYNWIPLVLETRYNSNFYPLWRNIWFKDIINDKYWYVVQFLEDYKKITDFFNSNNSYSWSDSFLNVLGFRREALSIIRSNPYFWMRKFYN